MNTEDRLFQTLGRLEGKMDSVLERLNRNDVEVKELDDRVNRLEKDKSFVYGISAAVGGIIAVIVQIFTGGR